MKSLRWHAEKKPHSSPERQEGIPLAKCFHMWDPANAIFHQSLASPGESGRKPDNTADSNLDTITI